MGGHKRDTMILLSCGKNLPIQEVKSGDRLVGYNAREKGSFYGFYPTESMYKRYHLSSPEIKSINSKSQEHKLINIITKSNECAFEYNHKCLVKFESEKALTHYIVYLMCKEDNYRIGIFPLYVNNNNDFGLSARCRGERADKGWILKVFSTKRDAFINEQILSYTYNIPQVRFYDNSTGLYTQEELDFVWSKIGKNYNEAKKILENHNLDINLPFWNKNMQTYFSKRSFNELEACNIFPEIMELAIFDISEKIPNKSHRAISSKILKIEHDIQNTILYKLDVSREALYVANNILTSSK
jgi:hypothetical protein